MKKVPYIEIDKCTGCEICVEICLADVFVMSDLMKAVVRYPEKCMGCGICEENCPTDAIKIKEIE